MRIRDLKWRNLLVWPPHWSIIPDGAEGTLKTVSLSDPTKYLHVEAEFAGHVHEYVIFLENHFHLGALYQKLKENIGKPLTGVGELEL